MEVQGVLGGPPRKGTPIYDTNDDLFQKDFTVKQFQISTISAREVGLGWICRPRHT